LLKSPEEDAAGLLFGRYVSDAATIERCSDGARSRPPIGIFRTQPGGVAVVTIADCKRIQSAVPATASGALFLMVRTYDARPWSATLFTVDPRQPSTAEVPLLEFPFDEYLLRRWLTDLTPPPALQPRPAAKPQPRREVRWSALAAAAALIGGGAAAYRVRSLSTGANPSRPPISKLAAPATAGIGLNGTRNRDDLEISWNRASEAVRTATGGTLTIRNGPIDRAVPVSREQLREGRVIWHLVADADADFRLELAMPGGRTVAESIQVLVFDNPQPIVVPIAAPSVPQTLPPPKPKPAQRQIVRQNIPAGAASTEPVPIRRAEPVVTGQVREELQRAQGKVTISVLVRIDPTGAVDTAKVVSSTGEPSPSRSYIRLASLNAARQWKFRPATAAGKPAPSESTLVFSF